MKVIRTPTKWIDIKDTQPGQTYLAKDPDSSHKPGLYLCVIVPGESNRLFVTLGEHSFFGYAYSLIGYKFYPIDSILTTDPEPPL